MTQYLEAAVSKDGYTFSDFQRRPVPDYGDYSDPMPVWRRLGNARQFSARFRYTEPTTLTVIALAIEAE